MRFRNFAVAVALSALATSAAYAQASRTWVSGVGDDANPCSRTAPCKTFAGAISKTAAGGEIDTLDPGGFGAVTITKSITIDGVGGGESSVLVAGTNGIVISALSTDIVTLRNIQVNGINSGINGVRVLTAGRVNLDNVAIFGFTSRGLDIEPSTNSLVEVRNCNFWNNTGGGIGVFPSGGTPTIKVVINHSAITQSGVTLGAAFGIAASSGVGTVRIVATDSNISENSAANVNADGGAVSIFLQNCSLSGGQQEGVRASNSGSLFIAGCTIVGNGGNAVGTSAGTVFTYGDNYMASNGTNNTGSAASPGKQ
jgi:parallel beta helix pectate lyase-like protein